MASCVKNICTKNYQNLVIGFQVTVKNVGDVLFETQRSLLTVCIVQLFAGLRHDAYREQCFHVLATLLLGYRYSPYLFHSVRSMIIELF